MEQIEKKDPKASKLLESLPKNKPSLRQRCIDFRVLLRRKPRHYVMLIAAMSLFILLHWATFILLVYLRVSPYSDSCEGFRRPERVFRLGVPTSGFSGPLRDCDDGRSYTCDPEGPPGKFSLSLTSFVKQTGVMAWHRDSIGALAERLVFSVIAFTTLVMIGRHTEELHQKRRALPPQTDFSKDPGLFRVFIPVLILDVFLLAKVRSS